MTMAKRNYHMDIEVSPDMRARCFECGAVADHIDTLRATECSHVEPPCTVCGGDPDSNECRADCPRMLWLLGDLAQDPSVYVVGELPGNK